MDRLELTSLFVAVAGGEDGGVSCQQFDWQRFDPSYQRYRQPWAFDGHHPRDWRHPATVLKQPKEKKKRAGGGNREERGNGRRRLKRRKTRGKVWRGEKGSDEERRKEI